MIFAHGLFIDDVLWFAVPVGVALVVLRWAERTARRRAERAEKKPDTTDGA